MHPLMQNSSYFNIGSGPAIAYTISAAPH